MRKLAKERHCTECNIKLTNNNWWTCFKQRGRNLCKECSKRKTGFWRKENPEKIKEHKRKYSSAHREEERNWRRSHVQMPNGHYSKRLRTRPENCELCGKKPWRLVHHHWIKNRPDIGMWICPKPCHSFAEEMERNFDERYQKLKEKCIRECS